MSLSPTRWVAEAVPVAAVLTFWNLLAVVAAQQGVGGPVQDAGILMAALYVVERGVALSSTVEPPAVFDAEAFLRENVRLALPAGAWFLGAILVAAIAEYVHEFSGVMMAVGSALAGAGLGVVALYVVAVGYGVFAEADASDIASADD